MTDANKSKTRSPPISPQQKEMMIRFLNRHQKLLSGCNMDDKRRLWTELSQKLNAIPVGARKTWQEWQKVWYDIRWHARTKQRRGLKDVDYVEDKTLSHLIKLSSDRTNDKPISKHNGCAIIDNSNEATFMEVKLEPTEITHMEYPPMDFEEALTSSSGDAKATTDNLNNLSERRRREFSPRIWNNYLEKQQNGYRKESSLNESTNPCNNLEEDYDKMFIMSLLPTYKRLKPNDKLDVQIEILQSINGRLKSYSPF